MESRCLRINNTAWYCISIFYSRRSWHILLSDIFSFYEHKRESFNSCLTFFSEDRGEHIRVIFTSKLDQSNTLESEISNHFQLFLNKNPSVCPKEFSFGKGVWCYYPNNTLIWNRFEFKCRHIDFSEKLTFLIPFLLEDDMSIDNIFSVALFLSIKLLKQASYTDKISMILDELVKKIDDRTNSLIGTYNIDFFDASGIIDSYWDQENKDIQCQSSLYNQWEKEAENISLVSSSDSNYGELVMIICDHLGLNKSYYFMILNFLKEWHAQKEDLLPLCYKAH